MKLSTLLATCLLIASSFSLSLTATAAEGGKKEKETVKTWTRWELSPSADIYYRTEVASEANASIASEVVAVEFLNSYKKEVSFCFALNDNGNPADVRYQPVLKLKKNKSAVVFYPRPKNSSTLTVSISGIEVKK